MKLHIAWRNCIKLTTDHTTDKIGDTDRQDNFGDTDRQGDYLWNTENQEIRIMNSKEFVCQHEIQQTMSIRARSCGFTLDLN